MTYKLVTAYTADGEQLECLHATHVTPGYLESASTAQKAAARNRPARSVRPRTRDERDVDGTSRMAALSLQKCGDGRRWRIPATREIDVEDEGYMHLHSLHLPALEKRCQGQDKKKYLHGAMESLREAERRKKHPFAAGACR
ncbi:predicted protein [Histoplasma capsulatum var. duboisii H88]|uniref:Predicted protein n=2 Tax=Ajellomyces capsulatus TaxID=5037 RepID=F0UN52_AJEC8|nr:predicted protein [Histoplasma capsulatum H143]EGC47519.1 predicted protein [Histoplasma capsulatum var. duboisii H88]